MDNINKNFPYNHRLVVCAAVKYEKSGLIVVGARHFDKLMNNIIDRLKDFNEYSEVPVQGFVDQFGKFMDRKDALQVAKDAGQLNVRRFKTWPEDELFSEDLY
jgi:hypothetical protein